MLRSREYRQKIAFRKTIEDALYIDAPANMRPLFAEIAVKTGKPKFLNTISPTTLDMMYEEYAPEKWLSKMGAMPYSVVNDDLQHSGSLSDLADAIIAAYRDNWDNIWDAYNTEYKPLDNYNMYQKASYNSSQEHSGTDTASKSGTETTEKKGTETNEKKGTETAQKYGSETDTKAGTETHTQAGSESNVRTGSEELAKTGSERTGYKSQDEQKVSAFNSSAYSDATLNIKSGSDGITYGEDEEGTASARKDTTTYNQVTDTKSFTGRSDTTSFTGRTDTLSFTDRRDELSFTGRKDELSFTGRKDELSFTDREDAMTYDSQLDHTGYDELERSGNIGVTTSQQMLQSEIDLRQYNFIMQVFRDITDLIGLPIY